MIDHARSPGPLRAARHVVGAAALCVALASAHAAEEDPISSDRPDLLTSPDVVGKGRFQVELGPLVQRDDAGDQRTRTVSMPTLLRLGVTDTLELRLASDARMRTRETNLSSGITVHENGYADMAVGVKWQMQKGDAAQGTPAIGWVLAADLPSGSRAFRGRGVRPAILGALQWDLPGDVSLSLNGGAKYDSDDTAGRFVSGLLGAGLSKGFTDRLRAAVEIVGTDIRRSKYGGTVVIADLALMYLLTPTLQLDALVGRGLTGNSPKYLFTVGGSARF